MSEPSELEIAAVLAALAVRRTGEADRSRYEVWREARIAALRPRSSSLSGRRRP